MNCPYGKSRVLRLFCGSPKLVKKIEGWVSRHQAPLTSSRETFYAPTHDSNGSSIYALKKVRRKAFSLKQVLIVDDTPAKVINSYGNAIYIKEYKGENSDKELEFLAKYLLTLKDVENVRTIEKRLWWKLTI